jgi:hypothetical protein
LASIGMCSCGPRCPARGAARTYSFMNRSLDR